MTTDERTKAAARMICGDLIDENERLRDQMQKAEVRAHELDLVNGQYELENQSLRDALRTKERETLEGLVSEFKQFEDDMLQDASWFIGAVNERLLKIAALAPEGAHDD